ncbi:MAG: EAL domain-containing protein [Sphingomonadales bacterium]|nr:EAL domain-containing protein [Sphingomonadales bacterium]MBD3772446.1 EAL domain-containing protein [Paracoccaceae bacterium]
MFLGTGSSVLPQIARSWMGKGSAPDMLLVNALLLNIALIIFGWRRYAELTSEIAERRKAEERARELAETDPLTACLNRRSIGPATEALLTRAEERGEAVAFLMVDLDNFKLINDLNGHNCGDEVLRRTAERLRASLPEGGLLSRLGGDEFACAIGYDPRQPERADQIVCELIDAVAQPMKVDETPIEVTVSVGIAATIETLTDSEGKVDSARLMHKADIAMYHAKKRGRNGYSWYEPQLETDLRYRSELEAGIRRGVQNGEFVPYYEQQVDIASGELVGFEMLARWHSPDRGVVGPDIFIPVAEEIGLIAPLSEQLIGQAFDDALEWDPALTLSVNISPYQLRDPWFAQKILKLLVQHGFPAERLEIEITESCLHENIGLVFSMITSLRNQGVKISLDDFGTGYSSLSQLRALPFDRLKIDRSFVSELKDARGGTKLVNAIVSLGEGLDMPITAEGIEDAAILEALQKMGPLKGQGYHYGMPEDATSVHRRLTAMGRLVANAHDSDENDREAIGHEATEAALQRGRG